MMLTLHNLFQSNPRSDPPSHRAYTPPPQQERTEGRKAQHKVEDHDPKQKRAIFNDLLGLAIQMTFVRSLAGNYEINS
jgi:hypothetical protein